MVEFLKEVLEESKATLGHLFCEVSMYFLVVKLFLPLPELQIQVNYSIFLSMMESKSEDKHQYL